MDRSFFLSRNLINCLILCSTFQFSLGCWLPFRRTDSLLFTPSCSTSFACHAFHVYSELPPWVFWPSGVALADWIGKGGWSWASRLGVGYDSHTPSFTYDTLLPITSLSSPSLHGQSLPPSPAHLLFLDSSASFPIFSKLQSFSFFLSFRLHSPLSFHPSAINSLNPHLAHSSVGLLSRCYKYTCRSLALRTSITINIHSSGFIFPLLPPSSYHSRQRDINECRIKPKMICVKRR